MPAIVLLLLLAAALPAALYRIYRFAFYNPIPRPEDPYRCPAGRQYRAADEIMLRLVREFAAIPFEEVRIRSYDGLELYGRYYEVRCGAPLQIQMHGYHGTALRDFCGGNKLAREAGLNTLVVDERARGGSGGRSITFGVKERLDCLAWARCAAARFGEETPITLAGVSMGAATVLMAADLPLPGNVKGIIADCPYSSPRAIIEKDAADMGPTARLFAPLADWSARLFARFDWESASALSSVRRTKLPILLLHGEDDRFVPCSMSREIAAACATPVRLETFPGAGHGLSYIVDGERYRRAVLAFLADCGALAEGKQE